MAPTSETVRPNPASMAVRIWHPFRSEEMRTARRRDAPSTIKAPPYCAQAASTARWREGGHDRRREDELGEHHGARGKEQAQPAERAGARQQQVKGEADDDRRKAETRVGQDDDHVAPGKGAHRKRRPERDTGELARAVADKLTPSDNPTIGHSPAASKIAGGPEMRRTASCYRPDP